MKKAYLITAYDQPKHFSRLIRALNTDGVQFYIHIDKNVDIAPFKDAASSLINVKFIKSIPITWMGFSQVESTLALLREASKERCEYYSLLSGSDYPIKPNSHIMSFFERARTEFIAFWKLEDRPSWLHKIQYPYVIDWVPILNYQQASFRRYFWGYFYKLMHYVPKRKYLPNMIPYGGSHWWSLSYDCVMYILDFVAKNHKFIRFYRYTHCPSEMFFQTIILNSNLAGQVQNYEKYNKWRRVTNREDKIREKSMLPEDSFNLRYMDWSYERAGGLGRPAILDETDFDKLLHSECLFARKFDSIISAKLLSKIDNFLR